jgi:hypothetical protein
VAVEGPRRVPSSEGGEHDRRRLVVIDAECNEDQLIERR